MSQIKVIVTDVDGTLLTSDKRLTEATKAALLRAQESGIRLVLASGRPTSGLISLGRVLEMDTHDGLFVSYNGSKVVHAGSGETLYSKPLGVEAGKAVLEHLKSFDVYPMIDRDNYMYVNNVFAPPIHVKGKPLQVIEYEARGGSYLLCEQADLAAFLDFPVSKILTAGEPDYLRAHYQEMMAPFADTLSCMFTADFYFEFAAKGVDKASALDAVLTPMGYRREEILGFGDAPNDLSMLRYAGTGVAMGNAAQEVKDAADKVAAPNDADGIALFLESVLPM